MEERQKRPLLTEILASPSFGPLQEPCNLNCRCQEIGNGYRPPPTMPLGACGPLQTLSVCDLLT